MFSQADGYKLIRLWNLEFWTSLGIIGWNKFILIWMILQQSFKSNPFASSQSIF